MDWFMVLFSIFLAVNAQEDELLKNPDFEDPFDGDWSCVGCQLERTNEDSYQGQWAGKVTDRSQVWHGVTQYVDLAGGEDYYFTAWIKLLNDNGELMGTTIKCLAKVNYVDGEERYIQFGVSPYGRTDRGWIRVGGDFYIEKPLDEMRVYIQSDDIEINYLVDAASLTKVDSNPNWKQEANERIEQIRKQDVDISVTVGVEFDPDEVEIEVTMDRHDFAFGTAIVANLISDEVDDTSLRYQEVFYENFEWAVFENAMKWKQMERNQYDINFARVDNALSKLQAQNIPVRGHCLYWGVEQRVPDWFIPLQGEDADVEMQRRMDYMMERYGDSIVHWDVNNEQLHGSVFELASNRNDLLDFMFKDAHAQAPDALLMLNDFSVVSGSASTIAMTNAVQELQMWDSPLHGIGVQSHFQNPVRPNIVAKRLDVLAEMGLPIWVTELDVTVIDREERANNYEDILRLYYSRPEIDGVLIWGFWDEVHWRPDAALWEGPNIEPNAAGQRWMDLVQGEWTTSATLIPTSVEDSFALRAYQGVYSIDINYEGQSICKRTAEFDVPEGIDPTWDITVEEC